MSRTLVALLFLALSTKAFAADDIIIADFEGETYGEWKTTGEASGHGPARGTLPGQMHVDGFKGKGLVNSFYKGDRTTGTLTSPPFKIERKYIAFLISGAVSNALNMPSISVEEAPRLRPYVALAEQLGSFAGQLTERSLVGIAIEYAGEVGELNTRALTSALLAALLRPMLGDVNMVSAPAVARERGIRVDEIRQTHRGVYDSYIRLTVRTESLERSIAGTVFSDGKPRVIQIKGINMEA